MMNPTRSDETVIEVLDGFRPVGPATERRLMEVGRAAVEASPSARCDRPLARAAMSIELQELGRINPLVDLLVARSDQRIG